MKKTISKKKKLNEEERKYNLAESQKESRNCD